MVLFENVNVNQRVEVLRDDRIYAGTVKYKGNINGISGEWVGVELDLPGTYLLHNTTSSDFFLSLPLEIVPLNLAIGLMISFSPARPGLAV